MRLKKLLFEENQEMKIGIETIVDYSNYGNRLQNLALQIVLEKLGNEVVTIRDYTSKDYSFLSKVFDSIKTGNFLHKIKVNLSRKNNSIDELRKKNFINFTNKYINESSFYIDETTKDYSFDNQFDCYVIGSDQVWNFNLPGFSRASFVDYSNKPKISYAASFGVSHIPNDYEEIYKTGLKKVKYISVRENAGKDIISDILHRKVEVVLDPTLLLETSEWKKLISNKEIYNQKYVLTYFLSPINNDDKEYIKKYASNRNLVIKNLANYHDETLWIADPLEFVNLFSQAEVIFTDSFHASVFSIIFKKPFEVFQRNLKGQNMNSRIETLFDTLGIKECWHDSSNSMHKIDYDEVNQLLATNRIESMKFLTNSLKDIES